MSYWDHRRKQRHNDERHDRKLDQIIDDLIVTNRNVLRSERKVVLTIMATVSEAFNALRDEANKAYGEINGKIGELNTKIEDLTTALGNRELTPEEQAALDEVKTSLQALDDIVPDAAETLPVDDTPEEPVS